MDPQSRDVISAELRATAAAEDWTPWQLVQAIHDKAETPTLLMAWLLAARQTQAEVIAGVRGLAADDGKPCSSSCPVEAPGLEGGLKDVINVRDEPGPTWSMNSTG
ncbi:hypothetical protein ACTWPT_27020 [Nonomuraea sp. 3N208]|uniref:hypothetical protein n=1 Tax=Nonomuraea sp. 3N208 TaxID=3457421 RepID=UPI003FD1B6AE